jgi:hypothetical protein
MFAMDSRFRGNDKEGARPCAPTQKKRQKLLHHNLIMLRPYSVSDNLRESAQSADNGSLLFLPPMISVV